MDSTLNIEINFEVKRCRACLQFVSADENFVDLLDTTDEDHSLEAAKAISNLDCFNECTQLKILPKDLLREYWTDYRFLCAVCKDELTQAYQFITKARRSSAYLRENQPNPVMKTEPIDSLTYEFELEEDTQASEHNLSNEIDLLVDLADSVDLPDTDTQSEAVDEKSHKFVDAMSSSKHNDQLYEMFGSEEITNQNSTECEAHETITVKNKDSWGTLTTVERIDSDFELIETGISATQHSYDEEGDTDDHIIVKLVHSDSEEEQEILEEETHFFRFSCEFCTETFKFQRDLIQHYAQDHDENSQNFTCVVCEKRFSTKTALRMHKRQIHENCEYIDCQQCGRFILKNFYGMHLKKHNETVKFLCSQCPNTFRSKYALDKHMERHADKRFRNFECNDCGRKFYEMEYLQLHQITHQNPEERETYSCSVCDKTFLRKSNLKLHMQMHRGVTIDCPYCAKQFVRRRDLEIHIRFHTGDFPYSCSMCDRKFAIKSHLNYHEKRHSGVRYKCSVCDKTFINLSGLKHHSFEHTGMPLVCKICMRGFPTKFKMRRHIRCVHHNLFKDVRYTDELADQHYTQEEQKLVAEKEYVNEENEDGCMVMVEFLEEDES